MRPALFINPAAAALAGRMAADDQRNDQNDQQGKHCEQDQEQAIAENLQEWEEIRKLCANHALRDVAPGEAVFVSLVSSARLRA